jgi:hypothetical protein
MGIDAGEINTGAVAIDASARFPGEAGDLS